MASYTRQSTFADGDLITAALFNNEYNQLVSAFDNATGHKHDGTIGEGPVISVLGDAGLETPLNKILIDTINDHIEFYINVSETSTQQLYIADGAIVPTIDNDIDLGTNSLQFKDLYINGTANIDSLVADTADINGGTIDGVTIGGTSAGAITGTTITGTSFVIGSATITETELEILDGATLSTTELNYVGGVTSNIQTQIDTKAPLSSPNLTGIPTAPTAAANTNTTQVATTAYVQTEITDLIGAAPGTLDTLNELAAAINNDANYNTTLTTALATKLPLAGGTMTGNVTYGDNVKANFGTSEDLQIYHDGSNSYITDVGTGNLIITGNLTGNVTGNVTGTVSDISNHSTSDLSEGTNLYYTDARFDTRLATKDTDDVSEGTSNLYYTDARVQNVSINNVVEDTTPQLGGTLDLNSNNITGTGNIDVTGTVTSDGLTVDGFIQFTDSGSSNRNILYLDGSDNVVLSTGTTAGFRGINLYTNNNKSLSVAESGDISFYDDTGTTQALFWDASTERLGLGTTSPTTTLDVNGTIKYGNLSDGTITITGFADEDDMVSNSATLLPTQQSVKAYVDSQVSSAGGNGISFADNEKAQFGAGSDLQIYHDGTHSYLLESNAIGNLYLGGDNLFLTNANATKVYVKGIDGGATELRHNNLTKLATTSTGIDVTGTVKSDGLTVDGDAIIQDATPTLEFKDTDNNLIASVAGASGSLLLKADTGNGTAGESMKFYTGGVVRQNISGGGDISFYDDTGTSQALFWDASAESLGIGTTSPRSNYSLDVRNAANNGVNIQAGDEAADIALSVGSAGTPDKFVVTSGGSVGIGTSSPANLLQVGGTVRGTASIVGIDGASPYLKLDHTATTSGRSYSIYSGGLAAGNFDIYDNTASAARLSIDSSGNVGIGTSSPNARLEIKPAASSNYLQFNDSSDTEKFRIDSNFRWAWGTTTPTQDFDMRNTSGNAFFALDRGNERVGIGTDSPDTLTHIAGAGGLAVLRLENTESFLSDGEIVGKIEFETQDSGGAGVNAYIQGVGVSTNGATRLDFGTGGQNAPETRMTINSNGNVGIGTASPDANSQLHIKKIGANAKITLETDESNDCYINFSGATSEASLGYEPTSNAIVFANAGDGLTSNERMRITSSGNIGIGTTSPSAILHTVSANANGTDLATSATNAKVRFQNHSTSTLSAYQGYTGNSWYTQVANSSGTTSYDLSLNPYGGNVGIGTPTPNYKLEINHTGADTLALVLNDEDTVSNATGLYLRSTSEGRISFGSGAALTFAGNGGSTERMRINSAGRVGIGTSSPDAIIETSASATGNTVGALLTNTNGSGTADSVSLNFGLGRSADGYIRSVEAIKLLKEQQWTGTPSTVDAALVFSTVSNEDTSERMRIDSSGNVGINRTSPNGLLHIQSSSGTDSAFYIQTSAATDDSVINFGDDSSSTVGKILYAHSDNSMQFNTLNSEAMRIDSSGNVGIGTTSPSSPNGFDAKLQLESANPMLVYKETDQSNKWEVGSWGGNYVIFNGTDERMRIDSSGRVGLGTSSPSRKVHIDGGSTDAAIQFTNTNTGSTGSNGTYIGHAGTGTDFQLFNYETGYMRFGTAGSEKMRIDSSGILLVGKTSGGALGTAGIELRPNNLYVTSTSDVPIYANRNTNDGDIIQLRKDSTTVGSIGTRIGDITIGTGDTGLRFSDGGDSILPAQSGSSGDRDAAIDLGASGARFKDLYLSGQANVGSVLATGDVTAFSDERLKENIKTLQGSKVLKMRGVSFTKDGKASSGVIAQEIEKVAPELVHTAKDEMGTKSVAYGNLVGYLIEAIKEQQKEIEYMKSEIKTLKENK